MKVPKKLELTIIFGSTAVFDIELFCDDDFLFKRKGLRFYFND